MIRKNTILSLLVACGLLLVGSAAYAQPVDSQCQSIGARAVGANNQLTRGINVVNNCNAFLALSIEFAVAGCDIVDDTITGRVLENGESCNLVATVCDAVFTCFVMVPDFCVDVPECTIP